MTLTVSHPEADTCRLDFDEVDDLRSVDLERLRAKGRSIRRLVLVEAGKVGELPEPSEAFCEARAIDLDPLLGAFTELRELYIDANLFPPRLAHPTVEAAEISGIAAEARLHMPKLRKLRLACPSSAHAALSFEVFAWLLDPEELPALTYLDLRPLACECTKKPSFVQRWAEAPVLRQLRHLGLPGQDMTSGSLKRARAAFAELDVLVVHGLMNARGDEITGADKNPIGGNVIAEIEFLDVPLDRVREAVDALPKPEDLAPKLDDAAFEAACERLRQSTARYESGALTKMIRPFVRKRSWDRVEQLLELAKKKAAYRRAYMDVREQVEHVIAKVLEKRADPVGQKLHDRLHEENRL